MRFLGALAVVIALFADAAHAETCGERAAACMRNGGTKEVCYGAALASCKRSCTYVGPYTGKSFPASGDCGSATKGKKDAKN
jgi:hypothetical protein